MEGKVKNQKSSCCFHYNQTMPRKSLLCLGKENRCSTWTPILHKNWRKICIFMTGSLVWDSEVLESWSSAIHYYCLTPVSQMEVGCSRIWGLTPTTQIQVGGTNPIGLPYPQPSHEPRPPPQTPKQAPVTLNSTFNGETIEEKPLPPRIGRGGRRKTRKHTNATTPNAEPSQSHEAMRRRTSNTQRSRWPLELPENTLGKHPTAQQNTRATKRYRHPPQ